MGRFAGYACVVDTRCRCSPYFAFRVIHVVSALPVPPSFQYSVLERASSDPELSALSTLIGKSLVEDLDLHPLTFFAPEDDSLDGYNMPQKDIDAFLLRHMFEGLFFADSLKAMHGEMISSVNGQDFLISVERGAIAISDPFEQTTVYLVATDILGHTGIMHRISGPLADAPMFTTTANPTLSTTQSTLTGEVMVEIETVAPTESQTEYGTIASSETNTMDASLGSSNEMDTMLPSTDSPTIGYTMASTETTLSGPTIEASRPINESIPRLTMAPSISSNVPSASPTQLIEVVSNEVISNNTEGILTSPQAEPLSEGQVVSATSNAEELQFRNKLVTAATSLLLLLLI